MKIQEVERELKISKANIRYYEKEGLLTPKRLENGYREYGPEDIDTLRRIILLRKIGMSISDIRDVSDETLSLNDALTYTVKQLETQIEELKGALSVATLMKAENISENDLDVEYYWKLIEEKENNGDKFIDVVMDYFSFEKKSFLAMWENVFFLPLSEVLTKKGWFMVILTVIGVCVFRGIGRVLFWHDTFLSGFSYPFWLFIIITLITLPLYIMDYPYRNSKPEERKEDTKALAILKVIGVIGYIPVALFMMWGTENVLNNILIDSDAYVSSSPFVVLCFVTMMYLFAVLVWSFSKQGLFGNRFKGEKGLQCHLPMKKRRRVIAFAACLYLVSILLQGLVFRCVTEEGFIKRTLWMETRYTFEDVDFFSLSQNWDGVLNYVVVLKDGTRIKCMGDISNDSFPEDKYLDYDNDFVKMLTKKFRDMNIPSKYVEWETLPNQFKMYEFWREYTEELREIYVNGK